MKRLRRLATGARALTQGALRDPGLRCGTALQSEEGRGNSGADGRRRESPPTLALGIMQKGLGAGFAYLGPRMAGGVRNSEFGIRNSERGNIGVAGGGARDFAMGVGIRGGFRGARRNWVFAQFTPLVAWRVAKADSGLGSRAAFRVPADAGISQEINGVSNAEEETIPSPLPLTPDS